MRVARRGGGGHRAHHERPHHAELGVLEDVAVVHPHAGRRVGDGEADGGELGDEPGECLNDVSDLAQKGRVPRLIRSSSIR